MKINSSELNDYQRGYYDAMELAMLLITSADWVESEGGNDWVNRNQVIEKIGLYLPKKVGFTVIPQDPKDPTNLDR